MILLYLMLLTTMAFTQPIQAAEDNPFSKRAIKNQRSANLKKHKKHFVGHVNLASNANKEHLATYDEIFASLEEFRAELVSTTYDDDFRFLMVLRHLHTNNVMIMRELERYNGESQTLQKFKYYDKAEFDFHADFTDADIAMKFYGIFLTLEAAFHFADEHDILLDFFEHAFISGCMEGRQNGIRSWHDLALKRLEMDGGKPKLVEAPDRVIFRFLKKKSKLIERRIEEAEQKMLRNDEIEILAKEFFLELSEIYARPEILTRSLVKSVLNLLKCFTPKVTPDHTPGSSPVKLKIQTSPKSPNNPGSLFKGTTLFTEDDSSDDEMMIEANHRSLADINFAKTANGHIQFCRLQQTEANGNCGFLALESKTGHTRNDFIKAVIEFFVDSQYMDIDDEGDDEDQKVKEDRKKILDLIHQALGEARVDDIHQWARVFGHRNADQQYAHWMTDVHLELYAYLFHTEIQVHQINAENNMFVFQRGFNPGQEEVAHIVFMNLLPAIPGQPNAQNHFAQLVVGGGAEVENSPRFSIATTVEDPSPTSSTSSFSCDSNSSRSSSSTSTHSTPLVSPTYSLSVPTPSLSVTGSPSRVRSLPVFPDFFQNEQFVTPPSHRVLGNSFIKH